MFIIVFKTDVPRHATARLDKVIPNLGEQQSKKNVSINLVRKALSFAQKALSFQKRHSQQSQNNELQDNQKCLCWMAKLVLIG